VQSLNDKMEFDHVVRVHPDGTVTDGPTGVYAPEVTDDEVMGDGWTLLRGYTGQHGYSGPTMHPSEYIGGGLERDILARPGLYVAVVSTTSDPEFADDPDAGWCVAFRELPEQGGER
jgi:hypothetical protein